MKCGVEIIVYRFSYMFELKWNLGIFLESSLFSLITISLNLFYQLVIAICNQVMQG